MSQTSRPTLLSRRASDAWRNLWRGDTSHPGRLIGDPNYGYDLTQFVNDDVGPADLARIEANAAAEAKKDERVQDAEVSISVTSAGVMIAKVTLETSDGPFVLVLSVTDVNVEILKL